MPYKNIVSKIENDEKLFEEGNFARELSLNGTAGNYLVEISLFREVIGSIRFEVNQ